ncbi:MAG: class I SAM-dependent methyltransferase [Bacteroidota bacterium]
MAFGLSKCTSQNAPPEEYLEDEFKEEEKDNPATHLPDQQNQSRDAWQSPLTVISLYGDIQDKVIADIGSGSGYFSFRMAYMGAKVLALDIDREALKSIEDQKDELRLRNETFGNNIYTRVVAENDAKLKENEVDHVLIVNTFPFINNRVDYLKRLIKAIKPGGTILIADFKMKKLPPEVAPPLDERLPLYVVEQELEQAGFKLLKSDDASLDFLYMVQAMVE